MIKPQKPLFEALKEGIARNGLSVREAARQAGTPYESLKSWLRRNKFPRQDLSAIARIAGLAPDLDELERTFEFTWARAKKSARTQSRLDEEAEDGISIYASNALIDARLPKIKRLVHDLAEDVESQFGALAKDDLYVHCSFDVPPVETKPLHLERLGGLVAEGVRRGVQFTYLMPSAPALTRMASQGMYLLPSAESVEACFTRLMTLVQDQVNDSGLVREHLRFIPCDENPFFVAGHTFSIFRYQHELRRESGSRCFGCFPVGLSGESIELHLPMNQHFTQRFWDFCEKTLGD